MKGELHLCNEGIEIVGAPLGERAEEAKKSTSRPYGDASYTIQAKAYQLEKLQKWDSLRQDLQSRGIGTKSLGDFLSGMRRSGGDSDVGDLGIGGSGTRGGLSLVGLWDDSGERVILALCPSIRPKRKFWEELAKGKV